MEEKDKRRKLDIMEKKNNVYEIERIRERKKERILTKWMDYSECKEPEDSSN